MCVFILDFTVTLIQTIRFRDDSSFPRLTPNVRLSTPPVCDNFFRFYLFDCFVRLSFGHKPRFNHDSFPIICPCYIHHSQNTVYLWRIRF